MPAPAPNNILVSCRNCAYATFMQWFKNPVIANCAALGERQVADSQRRCKLFVYRDNSDREIQHFDHYDITE